MASKAGPHTDAAIVKKCQDGLFLAQCLAKAGFDNELCSDVTDACEVAELTALDLASGDISTEDAAQRLFLVKDEARKLLKVCTRLCAREGVNFGEGVANAESSEEESEPHQQHAASASSPPRASSPTPEATVEPCSGSGVRHGDQDNLENAGGPAATSAAGLPLSEHDRPVPSMDDRAVDDDAGEDTAAVREEQERKQRQLKEEQLAAAQAAFAPKPIPASASALAASQPTHDNFPPGFAPPSASSKHSPALPHARKLSAYDGVSFGVRDQAFSPAPTPPARVQSARTSGRHSAAPSPYTPPTYGTSVRQIGTPRMTSSVAASRYQYDCSSSKTKHSSLTADDMRPVGSTPPSLPPKPQVLSADLWLEAMKRTSAPTPPPPASASRKPTLSAESMKPANMTQPTRPPHAKAADEYAGAGLPPLSPSSPPRLRKARESETSGSSFVAPSPAPTGRVPSYARPTAAFQAQVSKRAKGAEASSFGSRTPSMSTRTPITPATGPRSQSTRLPAQFVHKVVNEPYTARSPYTPYGPSAYRTSSKAKRDAPNPAQVHNTPSHGNESFRAAPSTHAPASPSTSDAATNGNSERKARARAVSTTPKFVTFTQSAVLSPAEVAPQDRRPFKACPVPKFVHSAYASASHTPAAVTAATSPTAMPRMVSASADKASTSAREGRAAAVQHRQASMSEPEDEDPDDWNALGSSGRRYRSPSMLQPHPHIPMRMVAQSSSQKRPAWQSSSRVPQGPADDQLRVSAHIGTLIPNFGQHGAHALPKKQQLEEMRQQEQQHQALLRALSEANHRSAMEKAAQMQALKRRNSQKSLASHRSAKGDGSLRESLQSQGFSHEHRSTKGDSSLRESLHSHGSEHEDAQGRGARVSSDGCAPQRAHARPAGDREEEVRISGPMTPPTPEAGALPRERLAEQGVGSRHGEAEIRGAGDGCWSAEGHEVGSLGAGKGGEGSRGDDGCTAGTEGRVAAQCQT